MSEDSTATPDGSTVREGRPGAGRPVTLPDHVVERVEARLHRTDFETAGEYVTFVLEETLARVEAVDDPDQVDHDVADGAVEERLESLGYLDP